MIDESVPPDRNAPSGTSLWSRMRTAEASNSRSSSAYSRAGRSTSCPEVRLPVAADLQPALAIEGQVRRRQLGNAAIDRQRVGHVLVGEVSVEGLRVDLPRHAGDFQQAF